MKQLVSLLSVFVFISLFSFTSCKEDKYLDWKYLNQSWYNQHKNDEGWQTTASGLQYKVINPGIGDEKPSRKSAVAVSYTGTYITGKEFDSASGAMLSLSSVVPGFSEGLKKMKKNAIYEFRMPYEIGYGEDGSSPIPPYTTLIFRIELHDFWTE